MPTIFAVDGRLASVRFHERPLASGDRIPGLIQWGVEKFLDDVESGGRPLLPLVVQQRRRVTLDVLKRRVVVLALGVSHVRSHPPKDSREVRKLEVATHAVLEGVHAVVALLVGDRIGEEDQALEAGNNERLDLADLDRPVESPRTAVIANRDARVRRVDQLEQTKPVLSTRGDVQEIDESIDSRVAKLGRTTGLTEGIPVGLDPL